MNTVWKLLHETPDVFVEQMLDIKNTENPIFKIQFEILFKAFCADKRESPYIAHFIKRIIRSGINRPIMLKDLDSLEFEFFGRVIKAKLINKKALEIMSEPFYWDSVLIIAIVFELANLDQRGDDAIHFFAHHVLEILK